MVYHNEMIGLLTQVHANQAWRDAWVIAAVDGRALVEYVMPEGRTFLRILEIDEHGYIVTDNGRSVSYNAIPRKFVEHMRANFSLVLARFKGGFDPEEVAGKKHPTRGLRDRLKASALAVRCRVLDLPIPNKEVIA